MTLFTRFNLQLGLVGTTLKRSLALPMGVTRQLLWFALVGLMLPVLGCASGTTRRTSSIKSAKNVQASAAELSSRNRSLLGLYSDEIETTADKIITESHSPVSRRQALVWKAEAIPVLQASLLNPDPLAAVLDTWAFILQMKAYTEQPAVKQGWAEFHPLVAETLNRMEAQMHQLIQTSAPSANVAALRQKIASWAEAHPIEVGLAGRKSADPEVIRRAEQSDLRALSTLHAIEESLGDITVRLDSYNAYLPKQARWQAELLLSDLAHDPQVDALVSNFVDLSRALATTSHGIERIPEFVGQTGDAMKAIVQSERLAAQAFLQEERVESLNDLDRQRIATIADLRKERLAATADLQNERQIVLDALHSEQTAAMTAFNAASEKAIKDLDSSGRRLIDHFFLRALELVLLTLVLCALMAWILLRRFSSRRPYRSQRSYDRAA